MIARLTLLTLAAGLASDLGAQSANVAVGARVRVQAEYPYGQVVGRVERADRQVLRVVQDRTTAGLVVPVRYIHSLEVRRQRSRVQGMQHGAVKGAVVGLGAGLLLGALTDNLGTMAAVGLGAGVAGGAAYGMRRPGLTWERVDVLPPVRMSRR
ncbi:MAG TPA: hypothetical protein VKA84_06685 [Gemmatimonadaceae bacterium]|nr:hypothetical protein [Gemmatimonadaceae bacterium]